MPLSGEGLCANGNHGSAVSGSPPGEEQEGKGLGGPGFWEGSIASLGPAAPGLVLPIPAEPMAAPPPGQGIAMEFFGTAAWSS